jgi:5-methylcytosine-specific restriction endonuclease McrA
MASISNTNNDVIAKLIPGGAHDLARLSDEHLLANTRRIAATSNLLLAALLAHLAEVETRGIHRTRRCASLYTYCIYELRFSEDAAARRSAAAKLTKQFPLLLQAVAEGELHLTGLLMLGPHLTPDNHVEVLARAKFRTKKELAKLVRDLHPLPQVPDRIEPLGPVTPRPPRNPTWQEFTASFAPPVRELPPGERPRDWLDDGSTALTACDDGVSLDAPNPADEPLPLGPAPLDLPPVTGPQQYQVQFSTVEEHAQLVERARALLARERSGVTLGELHLEAMKLLVATLEKRQFAVTDRPPRQRGATPQLDTPPRQRGATPQLDTPPRQRGATPQLDTPPRQRGAKRKETTPPRRSRYIPAAERREVYRRDGARCTYVDARGERCCETRYLELHHRQPFARNGANIAENLTLRCAAHNALAAEHDFGPELVAKGRDSTRHEWLAAQPLVGPE